MKRFTTLTLGLAMMGISSLATAEEGEGGGRRVAMNPKVAQECSSCHIAYRPNFLPTSSWKKVMSSLDKHYGTDASLADADQKAITQWLVANSQEIGEAPPGNRITKAFWFTRKHGTRHIQTDVWSRNSVKSPSNCQACHVNAAQGDFNEHNIRIPR
ncbi:diheme cytochrome c [Rhodoferax sp.]|uniref:diheme cytochrome c n=1 Tax=Rhodoferax sp. TaxID=50421 RepID=UPI0026389AF0|nr:diheme cytochrome c [Rhodoferax sp.]MDD2809331.1 diheme cytochrome c [Rhodoferax sp.]